MKKEFDVYVPNIITSLDDWSSAEVYNTGSVLTFPVVRKKEYFSAKLIIDIPDPKLEVTASDLKFAIDESWGHEDIANFKEQMLRELGFK